MLNETVRLDQRGTTLFHEPRWQVETRNIDLSENHIRLGFFRSCLDLITRLFASLGKYCEIKLLAALVAGPYLGFLLCNLDARKRKPLTRSGS